LVLPVRARRSECRGAGHLSSRHHRALYLFRENGEWCSLQWPSPPRKTDTFMSDGPVFFRLLSLSCQQHHNDSYHQSRHDEKHNGYLQTCEERRTVRMTSPGCYAGGFGRHTI